MADTTICLYGKSGTYKTSNIGFLAKYLYKKTGKPLRLVSTDGGGWQPLKKYIQAGMIIPYSIIDEKNPQFLLHKLVQGYWPVDLKDGRRITNNVRKSANEASGYAFEGITSMSEWLLKQLGGKKLSMNPAYSMILTATGEKLTSSSKGDQDTKSYGNIDKEDALTDIDTEKVLDDITIGAAGQDHYGFVQNNMIPIIVESWNLPVSLVIWTGHEAQAEDEMEKATIRGVALVGKKGTAKIGRSIGMMIHAYQHVVKELGPTPGNPQKTVEIEKIETRYHFTPHPDNLFPKMVWEAKPRIDSELIPKLLEKWPGGYIVPDTSKGIEQLLEFEDEMVEGEINELLKLKEEVDKKFNFVLEVKKDA